MLSLLTRFGANAPGLPAGLLPAPVPLPSLKAAFSRRAALFGAVVSTGALAGSAVQSREMYDVPVKLDPVDADLTALADELDRILDGAAYALDPDHDDVDQNRRLRQADELILRIVDLPAAGPAGLKAKGKAYLDSASYDVLNGCDLATSLAEDVERVIGGAP